MAAASPEEFASRWWRVENSVTVAKKHGSTKFALVMKYRTSATHAATKYASKPFSSHEPSYAKLWDSKEEALQPENVQRFRDFVQRGFAHGGGSTPTPKRPHEDMEGGAQQEEPRLRGSARYAAHCASLAEKAAGSVKASHTPRLSAVSHSAASDEAFSVTGAPAPRHLAAEQASSAAVLAMTTW